jgi:hypothetical protein
MPKLRRSARPLVIACALGLAAPAAAEIDAGKREAILELLRLSGGEQVSERVAEAFLAELRGVYPPLVEEVMRAETDLSEDERARLHARLSDFDRFSTAFRGAFAKSVDVGAVFESVYVPLYDRHFDAAELREIVAFYRSPTGRKTLSVMPALMDEGLRASLPVLQPRVMALVGEILARERAALLP